MYDADLVQPMREELTKLGVKELRTAADVDAFMNDKTGSKMIVVNSVCGCAAGAARPGLRVALQGERKPDRIATVFAGQDREATERARSYFADFPPSSPSIALWVGGELVHFIPRHKIEGRDALMFGGDLAQVFEKYCAPAGA
jgi:putative YphP/YqiW family bacilliredoxin